MNHKTEEFLGVDIGEARIGIARGNTVARIAEPLATVRARQAIAELTKLAQANDATGLVIGLPRGLDGQDTAQTKTIRQWAERAKAELSVTMYWQDEALTTKLSEKIKQSPAGNDAVAASIILQDFLNAPEDARVPV